MSDERMVSLVEIQDEMKELYAAIKQDEIDLKKADSLANVAGKRLKSESLILAREMWENPQGRKLPKLVQEERPALAQQ